jgi:hypothetical protein
MVSANFGPRLPGAGDQDESVPRRPDADPRPTDETCDICGSADTLWRNCKLLCRSCGGISKSCADL